MDALSSVLEATRLRSVIYKRFPLTAPWGLDVVEDNNSQFWRLVSGNCFVGAPDGNIISMNVGDLIFIPNGSAHWIADNPKSLRMASPDFIKSRQAGIPVFESGTDVTLLVAGHFEFDYKSLHPFLKDMPPVIHIRQYGTKNQLLLRELTQLILDELTNEKPGTGIMLKRLSDILFVNIIRAYLEQVTPERGFLSALNDQRISLALKLMQEKPQNNWTLESLSYEIGMSRSVFFNQFKKLLHETPLDYLTNWRIRKAQLLMADTSNNISEIAESVGYTSLSSFNRAFKSKTGLTPALYRRTRLV